MKEALIDAVQNYLLASADEMQRAKLPQSLQTRMLRLREFYAYWLQYPRTSDKELAQMIRDKYDIRISQSYEDVRLIKICLGAFNRLTKEYDRYLFRQRCEEGWQLAREAGDIKSFAAITSAYVKGTGLDKDELTRPDYSVIVPQTFTITGDPSAAGFKVVPGILEKAKKMEQRYIQEAEIVNEYKPDEESNTPN